MNACQRTLVEWLQAPDAKTVQQMGWTGVKNGELLRRAENQFDLLLTADKRLRYQQNLKGRRLAILVLPSNRLRVLGRCSPASRRRSPSSSPATRTNTSSYHRPPTDLRRNSATDKHR